ncbi:hypothetical protein [Nocardia macrotermitis]|uniref:hypothetical protein n=1 Tax=Nocardia macrotermitis TaxID=2585198 RepID=UPI003873AC27
MDCFSKKVAGYAMADHMRTELVIGALRMATGNVTIVAEVTVFHSDRGTQTYRRSSPLPQRNCRYCDPSAELESATTRGQSRSTAL